MKRLLFAFPLVYLSIFGQSVIGAETMYIQSLKANVYASPSFSSKVISNADKGTAVRALAKQGNWYRIEVAQRTGWVLKHALSTKKPIEKVSLFGSFMNLFKSDNAKSRRRASYASTTVGIRGLTDDEKANMDQDVVAAYEAVDKMEAVTLSNEEVAQFISERPAR